MKRMRGNVIKSVALFCCAMIVATGCIKNPVEVTSEKTVSNEVPIEFVDDKYNAFMYSGSGYVIDNFKAFFSLRNTTAEHLQYKVRIPIYAETNKGVESFFSFIDAEGKELVLELNGNEERAIALTYKDYNVVGYLGEENIEVLDGKVVQILVDSGSGFVPIESKSAITFGLEQNELSTLLDDYDPLVLSKFKVLSSENLALTDQVSRLEQVISYLNNDIENRNNNPEKELLESLIQRPYQVLKFQGPSGLKTYTGSTGARIYPSMEAPYICLLLDEKENPDNRIVNCINIVNVGDEKWGMVILNNFGDMKTGFIPYDELEIYEVAEPESRVEALGDFELFDRIEKLIGIHGYNYEIINENTCIYQFLDESNTLVDPPDNDDSEIKTLYAFVTNDYRVWMMRTDSPSYVLKSGYRVGDNAIKVLEYYRSHYEEVVVDVEDLYAEYSKGKYRFKLSETEEISFNINTELLTEDSFITNIFLY